MDVYKLEVSCILEPKKFGLFMKVSGSPIIIHGKLLHLKQPQDTWQCAKGLP
jgi:hypothetical protein